MDIKERRQSKAIEWINDLMQYADEKKLPMRVLDELEDCKKQLDSENVNWNNIDVTIMELLESIEEKTSSVVVKSEKKEQEVSVEQVEAQVKKMAQRCHTENIDSVDSMAERKNILINKNNEKLRDITHTKAHLEELKNENLYLQFFQNCKTSYEKDVFEMFKDMLQSISSNYGHMLDHMKSMFQSIGGYKSGIANEKFYYEYEERRIGIDKKIQGEIENFDVGGNDIISFGQKTKDTVRKIVKKLVRKRKLFAWIPLVILLCIFTFRAVATQEENQAMIESYEADEDSNDNDFLQKSIDLVKDKGLKKVEDTPLNVIGTVLVSVVMLLLILVITLGLMLIAILLLLIVCYMIYLRMLKKWCNNKICKECSEYILAELIQFEQSSELSVKLDAAMQYAANEYENQYMDILNNLFADTQYGSDNASPKERSKISALRDEWKKIKDE